MKRKTERISGYPGIYRILCKYGISAWREPRRGHGWGVKYGRHRKTFATFQDAKEFWTKTKSHDSIEPLPPASTEKTFRDVVNDWRELALPHRAKSTQIRYLSYLHHFESLNDFKVEAIVATDIDRLIALWKSPSYLERGHNTRFNYEHEFSVLKSIFNFYIERFNRNYRPPF